MDIVNALLALAAAIFSGMAVYLSKKYHRISLLHAKSENLQKFINTSWLLLAEYETIKNTLQKNEKLGGTFVLDQKLQLAIEGKLKELLALGKAISLSDLFSESVQKNVSDLYSLLRGVLNRPVNLEEISAKIKDLQNSYDNGSATK